MLDVINRAGGYTSEAYEEGAVFLRESVAISQKGVLTEQQIVWNKP